MFSVHPGSVKTSLSSTKEALNMPESSLPEYSEMSRLFEDFQKIELQAPELAAQTFVALAAHTHSAMLSGLYIDSQCDLGEMFAEATKKGKGRMGKENLYRLKMEQL